MAVTEGLCDLYPDYRQTLEMLGDEDLEPAVQSLTELAKSGDPYLAADATFYLARTKMLQEQYEDALPLLTELTGKMAGKSVQIGNATYLLAVSQARMLQRQEAIASFDKYLKEYPNAPERMRIGATRQLQQMQFVEEGSLDDVWERMDFSRRHLKLTRTGDKTQEEQDKIIAMLDQLIKKAEEKECNCSGEGQGEGEQQQGEGEGQEGQGKGAKGGNSQNENGRVTRVFRRGPESPWSKLRDKDRDPAFSAIKEKFPARYQQLIEQYYKSFQEGVE